MALLTPAERSFFGVLQTAVASDYQIFAKVRLADIVRPVRNLSRSGWQSAFNRICGKHVDFVLCDLERLCVVGVVELDDRTHGTLERGLRDNFEDTALANASIPVLRIAARQTYSPVQIREQIGRLIRGRETVSDNAAEHLTGASPVIMALIFTGKTKCPLCHRRDHKNRVRVFQARAFNCFQRRPARGGETGFGHCLFGQPVPI